MSNMLKFESVFWKMDQSVIGIDEAGRGPLAGPLIVAGVILPIGYDHPEINDSKKLSPKKREALYDVIINEAISFQIEIIEPAIIDKLNIYQATKAAMTKIALELDSPNVLTDAMPLTIDKQIESIIKGDQKSLTIAAASILAKVTRDRIMDQYDLIYPQYHFIQNKGYPTRHHLAALETYGRTPIHRLSYAPVAKAKRIIY